MSRSPGGRRRGPSGGPTPKAVRAWAAALAVTLAAGAAEAEPSVWGRARDPEGEARRLLVSAAESLELKHARALYDLRRRGPSAAEARDLAERFLRPAATLLEQAGAARSPDPFVRLLLASVYDRLGRHADEIAVLEALVARDPPPVVGARAFAMLAVACAHLGRVEAEIDAYGRALELEPLAAERATLLANRAEALMRLGDIERAVEGYRAALGLLFSSGNHLFGTGVTTLWGLAVALDRSGDLDGGVDAVRLARTYDPQDRQINGPGWFYAPEHDRHWYEALGHWAVARKADLLPSVRVEAFARAEASLREFVARAPADDKWLALGRARLARCEKERAAYLKQEATRRARETKARPR